MSYLDTLYRAFIDYRRNTAEDRECVTQRSAITKADADTDSVEVTRVVCAIEEDWIDAIEDGLTYVERAIAEERQFIRANGEIVPIEKVKRVSRDSVEHLSRHTNLITKESTGDDLIPEKLYTVERLNDYAVYENRFLYMLLTYLAEFIGMRYTRILDLTNTYHGKTVINRTVKNRQKEIEFSLDLDETRRDDPIMRELNPCKDVLERIGMLLKTVNHFLSTPLMGEVAKAPKLKPPITKTNVLKMDKNFKGAVALYDFIASYDKDGYTVEKVTKKMRFSEIVSDEYAELYALASFLTYEYGMGIKDKLKAEYDKEEDRRKALAEEQRLEQLRRLRRRISEAKVSPEEYMLMLEKQLRVFEGIHSKLEDAKEEVERLTEENKGLAETIARLEADIEELKAEIERLEQKYVNDIAELKARHEEEIAALCDSHAEEIARLNAEHERELAEVSDNYQAQIDYINEQHRGVLDEQRARYERELTDLINKHAQETDALNAEHNRIVEEKTAQIASLTLANAQMQKDNAERLAAVTAQCDAKLAAMSETVAKKEQALLDVKEENRLLGDLKLLSDGRLNALRHQYGLMNEADDFTTENAFNEIENQYNAFRRFFKGEWKKTKKKIRAELLSAYKTVDKSTDANDEDTAGDYVGAADDRVNDVAPPAEPTAEQRNDESSAQSGDAADPAKGQALFDTGIDADAKENNANIDAADAKGADGDA